MGRPREHRTPMTDPSATPPGVGHPEADPPPASGEDAPHRSFTDPPTDETAWRSWGETRPAIVLHPTDVLVVAPHPDDETLAVGAALARWAAAGARVRVLAVTDGEGSHPGRPGLVAERTAEQTAALADLGLPAPAERLHLPDGQVEAHHAALVAAITDRAGADTTIVSPWEHDAHTDHDACGRAAREAAGRTGATLLQIPVWAYQWATPGTFADLDVRRLDASPAELATKLRALDRYRSQLEPDGDVAPIVSAEMRSHFERPWELAILG